MLIGLRLGRMQFRHGWRRLVGIAVLIGLAGGLALAAAAGSRRTYSAVDRMVEDAESMHVLVNPDMGVESALDFEEVKALPMVQDASRADAVLLLPPGEVTSFVQLEEAPAALALDGGGLYRFDRVVLADGRMPDPDQVDELLVETNYAEREGIEVGDRFTWRVPSSEEIERVVAATSDDEVMSILNEPTFGQTVTLEVTGIGNTLEGVAVDEGFEPLETWVTPAFFEATGHPAAGFWGGSVRLDSTDSIPAFRAAVDAMVPDEKIVYQTLPENQARAERATRPAATALLIFTVIVGVIGLVLITQAFARRFQFEARDVDTLAVVGTVRRERFAGVMARVAVTAAGGTIIAVVLAWLASPLLPVGPARRAEPDPGLDFDPLTLLVGGALVFSLVVLAAAPSAWHWTRRGAQRRTTRSSRTAAWLSESGARVPLTMGVRFGLEPGRGPTAVPTRATIAGAATAVTIIVAIVVFAASLDRVVEDPRFYGSNWDALMRMEIESDGVLLSDSDRVTAVLTDDPAVEAASPMRIAEVLVDSQPVTVIAFPDDGAGIGPTVAHGSAPSAADQIALGRKTMDRLGIGLGDEVMVETPAHSGPAEVVGQVVLPGVGLYPGSDRTALGTGGVVSPEILGPPNEASFGSIAVDTKPGTDLDELRARLEPELAELGRYGAVFEPVAEPADIQSLSRLRDLPVRLAALLVALVAATVLHAMVVAVRTRRRDLAVLQGLGATARQIRLVGTWQGVTVGAAALMFGIPVGIMVGRWLWMVLAEAFGTIAEPVVPVAGIVLMVPSVLCLVALLGLLPVHRSLRHTPAEVLNGE